jgi:hypothetical protein
MPTHTTLSLREQLNGAVVRFLDSEGMTCPKTRDGLVMLINALGHYREEGKELFPKVVVLEETPRTRWIDLVREFSLATMATREVTNRTVRQLVAEAEAGRQNLVHNLAAKLIDQLGYSAKSS